MTISLVWEWGGAKKVCKNWRDGLRKAMEIIEKDHEVEWCLDEVPKKESDWILTWCDSNSNFSRFNTSYPSKRAIILTTNPTNHHNLQGFDIVFCESSVIYDECRMRGIRAVKAFGTDDTYFTPKKVKKDIEYFYPATFSPWKLQSEICHLGDKLTCIGTIQPDGHGEYQACVDAGVNVEVGYFPISKIRDYYRRSKEVIIPAIHGSERTVLEAMSCDIMPQVINMKNRRTLTYIQEFKKSGLLSPREFIKKNYSAQKYAQTILKAMEDYV